MHAARSRGGGARQRESQTALSVTDSAMTFLVGTTQRLAKRNGVHFSLVQRATDGKVCYREFPREVLSEAEMHALAKGGGLEREPRLLAELQSYADAWSTLWSQASHGSPEQKPSHPRIYFPTALLMLFMDMGITKQRESFCLVGSLTPVVEKLTLSRQSGICATPTAPPLRQPVISLCINAMEAITDVTEQLSPQAKATYLRYRTHMDQGNGNGAKELGEMSDECSDQTDSSDARGSATFPRFFLLSPHVPYSVLRNSVSRVSRKTDAIPQWDKSYCVGEACEILLVYTKLEAPVPAVGVPAVNHNPEVWGHVRYLPRHRRQEQKKAEGGNETPSGRAELFFLAKTVEDYMRLGSTFSWVYGWQLCYASQGPPPRSLPWLKLFSPGALEAVVGSESLRRCHESAQAVSNSPSPGKRSL
ncbi:hypothetical protein TRVL_08489 [Trypanosoma vivax]|uniref:Uncharacterized protein n=1 Tax=Trypanosoma vivax (strain Y486) TaxID=1055687 RepID=G0TUW6_TRYVY|nr:hypothetical protein TRVL_08489 [Trypanosoma vivax]CCC47753.1 conserved hypothetical protein [Trypanosoma vivax Y486]